MLDINNFKNKLKKLSASIVCIDNETELSSAVADYLECNYLDNKIILHDDNNFESIDWSGLNLINSVDKAESVVAVSNAWLGVEESGALLMASFDDEQLNKLRGVDHNIIVLHERRIVYSMEFVLHELRNITKTVYFVLGSTKNSMSQMTTSPALKPKYLHVILIKS